jgi:hypothetical protein
MAETAKEVPVVLYTESLTRRLTLLAAALAILVAAAPRAHAVSCTGLPTFAECTAYANGAAVKYNNKKYTAIAAISSTRDCPPAQPYNPSTDNWWRDDGTCDGGATATATARGTATATARATSTPTATPRATATSSGGSCPTFQFCTAYPVGAVVLYSGQPYTAIGPISSTRNCSSLNPSTDNWWQAGGSCGGGTPTPTATARATATATSGGGSGIGAIVSSAQFDQLWPPSYRNPKYNYADFVYVWNTYAAAACTTGTTNDKKRECAAIFAHANQEVGQGRLTRECYCQPAGVTECNFYTGGAAGAGYGTPGCDYKTTAWGNQACGTGPSTQKYWGRGPKQLSWNTNYCDAQAATGISNLMNDPNTALFSGDSKNMWRVAAWYWMSQPGVDLQPWPYITMHNSMLGIGCDPANGAMCGFANSVKAINGAIECPPGGTDQARNRVIYYNGSGSENDEDGTGGTLGILGYGGGLFGRRLCY